MVLTLDTHIADCLVDVLDESKGNQSDPRESGSGTRLRVRKRRSRVLEQLNLHFK